MKPCNESCRIHINCSSLLVAQKPWIMSGSIEQNILMTLCKDQIRFDEAVHYSGLEEDLKQFSDRERTMIGEKGINISGGQKARISLARAIYASPDIYLLDDILSSRCSCWQLPYAIDATGPSQTQDASFSDSCSSLRQICRPYHCPQERIGRFARILRTYSTEPIFYLNRTAASNVAC